ncbi:hypothetical protein [Chamaesiphon sp. VAR_69_metabat_338]|uniref:hypothetical protein n=1 Tax=Chamaesiphon sp. VAR_69_metabat_338 TaxID=2964704 RepID=UPI00286D8199|nr:hypothetical protein [Chamaesiphon sp. VAR_69_metabat_338]
MQGFLFLLFFIAIVAAIVYGCIYVTKKRRQDLELVARQLKMDFYPKGDDSIAPMLSNLEFFMYGERCRVSNLIRGQVKSNGQLISVAIFDYRYTICKRRSTEFSVDENSVSISSNEENDTFCQTVLVFYDESIDVPGFSLRPEHLWDKLANFAGYEDINFDRFPAFSKGYRLLSNQVDDVRNLFQPNLIKFYETNKICTEAIGPYLLVYPFPPKYTNSSLTMGDKTFTTSQYLQPKEVKPYFDLGLKLLSLLEKNMSAVRQ